MTRARRPITVQRALKPFERTNKAFWHWLLAQVWPNTRLAERLDPAKVRRVLLLRYDAIGDMITTLPTIRTLKRMNPAIEVDVMASPKNRAVIEHDPNVTRILELRERPDLLLKDILKARAIGYDIVFCCIFGKATKVGIIANWIGGTGAVKTTIWRGEKYWRFFNVQSMEAALEPSMWDKMLKLVPATLQYELKPGDEQPYIAIDDASRVAAATALDGLGMPRNGFIAVNITSLKQRNRWTQAAFEELVDALLDDRANRVVLLWMGEDLSIANEIAARVREGSRDRVAVYPKTRNVLEIVAVIEASEAVFSLDTGVVHMASATGRPTMAMYVNNTRAITEWRPYGVPYRAIESTEDNAPVSTIPAQAAIPVFLDLLREIRGSAVDRDEGNTVYDQDHNQQSVTRG